MNHYKLRYLLIVIIYIVSSKTLHAQQPFEKYPFDTTSSYRIKVKDGSEFIGKFVSRTDSTVFLKTPSIPKLEIPYVSIESVVQLQETSFVNGQYWFPNPNATRYLFSPSAFNLKAGEGYYQNTYLFLNSFNVGVTDNISIGGGLEILSTFGIAGDGPRPIYFLTPKIGFKAGNKIHAGGGILYASVPDDNQDDSRTGLGILYGLGTFGTEDKNITGGLGWGFVDGEYSEKPFITLSSALRMTRRSAFVTENWIVPVDGESYYTVISYGIRFFGEKLSVDLAFINSEDIVQVIPIGIPYVDFVVKF